MNWTDEDVRYEKRDSFLNGCIVGCWFMAFIVVVLLAVLTPR